MSEPMNGTHTEALATFEQSYAGFLEVFKRVPDQALAYVPPGDEYALGIFPMHLQDQLHDYTTVFQQVLSVNFAAVDLSQNAEREPAAARRYAYLAAQRPTGADRAKMLADLASAHQVANAQLGGLDEATATRTAPVIYSAGSAPYPTSACAILGWLSDHYQEHTKQAQEMLAQWNASSHQ